MPAAGLGEQLLAIVRDNQRGRGVGLYSICSSSGFVLEAGTQQARKDAGYLLIESTANQVNQFGGYSGMNPSEFARHVGHLADEGGLSRSQVILGGDHLGPYVWRSEPSVSAMEKAEALVRDCVSAGYTKIHLDASMALGGDDSSRPLDEGLIAARTAQLCQAAEEAYANSGGPTSTPVYVIGAEVPVPGGAVAGQHAPKVTTANDVMTTVAATEEAFRKLGLQEAWRRVLAVVVQPGVEFGDSAVFDYDHDRTVELSGYIERAWPRAYEAHSTDYQAAASLRQMVLDHFAILKVGPWLTFAMRESLFALEAIEREYIARKGADPSRLRDVLGQEMTALPDYWEPYYHGDSADTQFAREFSFSDRSRYYWDRPALRTAIRRLFENLSIPQAMPLTLVSQYLPEAYEAVHQKVVSLNPRELVLFRIGQVLAKYADACRSQGDRATAP